MAFTVMDRRKARKMRRQGKRLGDIAQEIGASKSSISKWTRNVSVKQSLDQASKVIKASRRKRSRIEIIKDIVAADIPIRAKEAAILAVCQ